MLTAEETVCNQEENMQKLMHELESKDAELEELVMNIEEMETRGAELEGLVQLLEVRKKGWKKTIVSNISIESSSDTEPKTYRKSLRYVFFKGQ